MITIHVSPKAYIVWPIWRYMAPSLRAYAVHQEGGGGGHMQSISRCCSGTWTRGAHKQAAAVGKKFTWAERCVLYSSAGYIACKLCIVWFEFEEWKKLLLGVVDWCWVGNKDYAVCRYILGLKVAAQKFQMVNIRRGSRLLAYGYRKQAVFIASCLLLFMYMVVLLVVATVHLLGTVLTVYCIVCIQLASVFLFHLSSGHIWDAMNGTQPVPLSDSTQRKHEWNQFWQDWLRLAE